jgi:glucuronate isomerase
LGGRLSDHGLETCHATPCDDRRAAAIFDAARARREVSEDDRIAYASYLMLFFGRLDAEKGWTKQLHLGARRNVSTRGFESYGRDGGYDSMGDWPQVDALGRFLDRLDRERALPRTILYNLNPADNYAFATMAGNFQDGTIPGKVQFGSGWWFLDQKEAMEWQINALSNTGLLARFVGMTTDSRSFMSMPRHEYFRRTICNLIGTDVERGEIPDHEDLLRPLIEGVCYRNARASLGLV